MSEVKNCEDPPFPSKRGSESICPDSINDTKKKQKLENPEAEEKLNKNGAAVEELETQEKQEDFNTDYGVVEGEAAAVEEEEEEEKDEEHSNGQTLIDRKGKGILIEESEDEDDDDDDLSGDDFLSDGDSDLSDDPLAEVDLDNILPSRTRRRVIQPGAYLAMDLSNNAHDNNDDDDDDEEEEEDDDDDKSDEDDA